MIDIESDGDDESADDYDREFGNKEERIYVLADFLFRHNFLFLLLHFFRRTHAHQPERFSEHRFRRSDEGQPGTG